MDFLAWQRGDSPSPMSADDLTRWQTNFGAILLVRETLPIPEASMDVLLSFGLLGAWIVWSRCFVGSMARGTTDRSGA
jgi:hypothetical protein